MKIHPTTFVHRTAVIFPNVEIGPNCYIGPHAVIGAPPESIGKENSEFTVIIKEGVKIHGLNSIDAGTIQDTIIESGCYIMKQTHIGHDCIINKNVRIAPGSRVGGHAVIGEGTNLGMGCAIHQRVIVPSGCMVGMNSTVTKTSKLESNQKYIGSPVKCLGPNVRK